jgi:hypothetical protein
MKLYNEMQPFIHQQTISNINTRSIFEYNLTSRHETCKSTRPMSIDIHASSIFRRYFIDRVTSLFVEICLEMSCNRSIHMTQENETKKRSRKELLFARSIFMFMTENSTINVDLRQKTIVESGKP